MKKLSILLIALMLAGCAGQTKMVKTNKGMMSKKQKKELKQNQKNMEKYFRDRYEELLDQQNQIKKIIKKRKSAFTIYEWFALKKLLNMRS